MRIKQSHERDRAQGRISSDRLAYSLSRIAEVNFGADFAPYSADGFCQAERRAGEAKQEYEYVSKLVKTEMGRFERERVEDFKETLRTFLEGMISRQREVNVHPSRITKQCLMFDAQAGFRLGELSTITPQTCWRWKFCTSFCCYQFVVGIYYSILCIVHRHKPNSKHMSGSTCEYLGTCSFPVSRDLIVTFATYFQEIRWSISLQVSSAVIQRQALVG